MKVQFQKEKDSFKIQIKEKTMEKEQSQALIGKSASQIKKSSSTISSTLFRSLTLQVLILFKISPEPNEKCKQTLKKILKELLKERYNKEQTEFPKELKEKGQLLQEGIKNKKHTCKCSILEESDSNEYF
jgi:hypothetical protein